MTKKIFLLIAMALSAMALAAQRHYVPHVWVGAHGGATLSEVAFSPSVRQSFVQGFTGGVSFRFAEERHVGLLAELNISQRGWQENFEEYPFSYKRHLTYIDLPILTHIFFGDRSVLGFFNLGPQISYMLADNIDADFDYRNPASVPGFPTHNRSTEQLYTDVKNRFDYGITAGLGVEYRFGGRSMAHRGQSSIYLEGRYYFGLGNIFPSSKKDTFSASRTSSILVTLGYHFRIK